VREPKAALLKNKNKKLWSRM